MKLWYSFLKELKLSSKGFYFYVELIMAAIIILVLLVFIPEEPNRVQDSYLMLDLPDTMREMALDQMLQEDVDGQIAYETFEMDDDEFEVPVYESETERIYLFDDVKTLETMTEKDRPTFGVRLTYDEDNMNIVKEFFLQGYESERFVNLYKLVNVVDEATMMAIIDDVEVRDLGEAPVDLNNREVALPSLLAFNGSLMGMFIIAAYIFLDKQEGTIKAYAVTASKVWHYLMSKVLVMTTVTIITTFVITLAVRGFKANYLMLLILLLTSSFFGSSIGLVVASFYDNMTKSFAAIYTLMMLFMLPAIAYFIPSWEPLWIKFIPTYFLINGFKEVIITGGDNVFVLLASLGYLAAGLILFMWSNHRFKGNLSV